jgi:hypothetical protein
VFSDLAQSPEQEQGLVGSCSKDTHLSGSIGDVEPIEQAENGIVERGQDVGDMLDAHLAPIFALSVPSRR